MLGATARFYKRSITGTRPAGFFIVYGCFSATSCKAERSGYHRDHKAQNSHTWPFTESVGPSRLAKMCISSSPFCHHLFSLSASLTLHQPPRLPCCFKGTRQAGPLKPCPHGSLVGLLCSRQPHGLLIQLGQDLPEPNFISNGNPPPSQKTPTYPRLPPHQLSFSISLII